MSVFAKKVIGSVVPEALILLAAVAFLRWEALHAPAAGFLRFYPYAVLATGIFLGWRFHRSSMLFALLVLMLATVALRHPELLYGAKRALPDGTASGALDFGLVALLVPLNLAGFALLRDRNFLSLSGLLRLGAVSVQAATVVLLVRGRPGGLAAFLDAPYGPERWLGWTSLPVPALVAFGLALLVLAIRLVLRTEPLRRGYVWALIGTFLGLQAWPAEPAMTLYLATAGLILVTAVIEASYFMAYRDGLTGLPARRALNEALLRLSGQYTVAMVDVDHFKKFNDRYGHDVGDQVLRMVAAELARVSGGGKVYRYGGEEFAILFPGKAADESLPYLERVREAIESSGFTLRSSDRPKKKPGKKKKKKKTKKKSSGKKEVSVTVSVGVAERDGKGEKPDQVIQAADEALYRAKKAGRNRIKS